MSSVAMVGAYDREDAADDEHELDADSQIRFVGGGNDRQRTVARVAAKSSHPAECNIFILINNRMLTRVIVRVRQTAQVTTTSRTRLGGLT